MSLRTPLSRDFNTLTTRVGVYALCDLDEVPIYVGKTADSIRARVRRHLTSARSDAIANMQLDVWELAFVRAWPADDPSAIEEMERQIYKGYERTIIAGESLPPPTTELAISPFAQVRILEPDEVERRKDPRLRLPRLLRHIENLLDVILNRKDNEDQRRSLARHFERLRKRYEEFVQLETSVPPDEDADDRKAKRKKKSKRKKKT